MILVDRDQDVHVLCEAYTACQSGWGQLVVVNGGVACGKTELVRTFAEQAVNDGAMLLSATGSQAEQSLPFGLLRQLFRGVEPFRLPNLSAKSPGATADSASIDSDYAGMLDELCGDLVLLARRRPVVIVVDDIQFADKPSLRALLYLQRRLQTSRVLLVFAEWTLPNPTYDLFRSELVRPLQTVHLQLAPLSRAGITELLDRALGPEMAELLAEECHALSGGNPLLVKALVDDQRAVRHRSATPLTDGTMAVSQQFARAVVACVRRWGPLPFAVACGLGVLVGRPGGELLGDLLGLDPGDVQGAIEVLETSGLVKDGQLRHARVRGAVLDNLPASERAALHLRAALLLHRRDARAADIGVHLVAAEQLGTEVNGPWAVTVLREAAHDHLAHGRAEAAIPLLELAVRASADETERAEILSQLMQVEWAHRPSTAARHLKALEAAWLAGTLSQEDGFRLAKWLLWYGHMDRLREVLATGAAVACGATATAGNFDLAVAWFRSVCPQAGQGIARVPAQRPREVARSPLSTAVGLLDRLRSGGPREEIAAAATRVLGNAPLGEETLDVQMAALFTLFHVDADQQAEELCRAKLAEATGRNAATWRGLIGAVYALALLRRGDMSGAAREAQAAHGLFVPQGWGIGIGLPLAVRVGVATRTGKYEDASRLLRLPVPEAMFQSLFGLFYLYERGLFNLVLDQLHAAMADFARCGELLRGWNLDLQALIPWRLGAARTQLAVGNRQAARALVEEQLTNAPVGGGRTRGMHLRVLAAASPPERRLGLLTEAVELLTASGDQFELSGALRQLSQALEAQGDFGAARATGERAAQLARQSGAEWSAPDPLSIGTLDAVASVGRQLSAPVWQVSELSEAERRVAGLAAVGLTNREIGAKLYITVSTVEQHLTRVYRKLRVNRRTDLPADLDQYAPVGLQAAGSSAAERVQDRGRGR
ncbi:AAA family ATPase [Streptomyces sp. DSM 44917]|uniref:AAA family ATPase n=1 Tax=Streptomyces boetiae TaxID=3075541 RepID=A0ABU2LBB0_9ACTN|nr:AAA family ATPase [Streptomyces sp. DSM 44917]MDT0308860.1 AAA family ATPase [Streptomyces sp. DSM 44917]